MLARPGWVVGVRPGPRRAKLEPYGRGSRRRGGGADAWRPRPRRGVIGGGIRGGRGPRPAGGGMGEITLAITGRVPDADVTMSRALDSRDYGGPQA